MKGYRKLVAVAVGLLVMVLGTVFGIGDGATLYGMEQGTVVQVVLALLTAVGVERFTNEPKNG